MFYLLGESQTRKLIITPLVLTNANLTIGGTLACGSPTGIFELATFAVRLYQIEKCTPWYITNFQLPFHLSNNRVDIKCLLGFFSFRSNWYKYFRKVCYVMFRHILQTYKMMSLFFSAELPANVEYDMSYKSLFVRIKSRQGTSVSKADFARTATCMLFTSGKIQNMVIWPTPK